MQDHRWTRVFGAGIQNVDIIYRAGRDNTNADALSRQPHLPAPAVGTVDDDAQVLSIEASDVDTPSLLELKPEFITSEYNSHGFSEEQKKDEEILSMISFQQEKSYLKIRQMHAELQLKHQCLQ